MNKKVPVLFLVFNRPEPTRKVFQAIRAYQPDRLYVAADGPRPHKEGEIERCAEVKEIASKVDWPCQVYTKYREKNLGCGLAVSEAITWFFEMEEMGIILEDDCLPEPAFFPFCAELLERYKYDRRIMQIDGSNYLYNGLESGQYSYHFSKFGSIWGWASWRRAWDLYDIEMSDLQHLITSGTFSHIFEHKEEERTILKELSSIVDGRVDTWDYQWTYSKLVQSGLSLIPAVNMIQNLGFGQMATHTFDINDKRKFVPVGNVSYPLKHPGFVIRDVEADARFFREFIAESQWQKFKNGIKRVIGHPA